MSRRTNVGLGRIALVTAVALLMGCPRDALLPAVDGDPEGGAFDTGAVDGDAADNAIDADGVVDLGADGPDVTTDVMSDVPVTDTGSGDAGAVDGGTVDTSVADVGTADTGPGDTGAPCPVGQQLCGGRCVSLMTDPSNCNSCGVTCPGASGATATCVGGVCSFQCAAGSGDCDAMNGNGCETNTMSNVLHCGGCSHSCNGTNGMPSCVSGACTITCNAGFSDCDGSAANGCEVNLQTTVASCGACGRACVLPNAVPTCVAGACAVGSCTAGFGNCDMNPANGCELSLSTNAANCGACGRVCGSSMVCVAAACVAEQLSCRVAMTPGCGLVAITGGTFTMGEGSPAYNASPVQTGIMVGNFALDAYEVTVARFNAFWAMRTPSLIVTIRRVPIVYPGGQSITWGATAQDPLPQDTTFNWSPDSTVRDAHPMNGVDYWISQEFCVWDGGRLPTEAEWEYAARGRAVPAEGLSVGRIYPWGDTAPDATCERAHWNSCMGEDGGHTRRVGRSPATGGLYDLAGSVWERVADNYVTYDIYPSCRVSATNPLCTSMATGFRAVRGGSWGNADVAYFRSASRYNGFAPSNRDDNTIGFRCARTVP